MPSSLSRLRGALDPPAYLLVDPAYQTRYAVRQRIILLLVSVLIILCNPLIGGALRNIPDLPPESLFTRIFPMVLAALAILYHIPQRSYFTTRAHITLLMIVQLLCSTTQTIESLNSLAYVSAALTPIYASQIVFHRIKDMLLVFVIAMTWYLVLYAQTEDPWHTRNILALVLFSCGFLITAILGTIRIKDLESMDLAYYESQHKSIALEQAEANARQSAEAAMEASRAKSAFLATMSHELRTPLNAIIGYSELLLETAEEDGHQALSSDLTRINTSAEHLLTLISDVLDLSKVEAGRMELVFSTIELRSMLSNLSDVGTTLATTNHNTLSTHLAPNAPTTLHTDAQKLRQILLNLLSNACKFTEHGHISMTVQSAHDDHIVFHVEDTGIGISETKLQEIFQPFTQVHGKLERERYGGTGLGLMICKRMVELLGGKLSVTSTPGQGSTFSILLPLHHPAATDHAS